MAAQQKSESRIRVCLSGATGNVGRCLADGILQADDMVLVSAVARSAAGRDLGEALDREPIGVTVSGSLAEALRMPADVLIDYTHPSVIRDHTLAALKAGLAVVVGTSGLKPDDYPEIEQAALAAGVGVATGNFAVTAALMQYLARIAAAHVPNWEIVEYNKAAKPDVPSATAVELAEMLSAVQKPTRPVADAERIGPYMESRGADIEGTRVHSVRLPGFASACEVVFGLPSERLSLRFDEEGGNGEPFVFGTLLAARLMVKRRGLYRGLDRLMFGPDED